MKTFCLQRRLWHILLAPSHRTTTSSQHARPSGVLRRRSDGLECAAWQPPRPVAQCRQFPEDAKDVSVSECTWTLSTLDALHNALYKFKTYLLTPLCRKGQQRNWWAYCVSHHRLLSSSVNFYLNFVSFVRLSLILMNDMSACSYKVTERILNAYIMLIRSKGPTKYNRVISAERL